MIWIFTESEGDGIQIQAIFLNLFYFKSKLEPVEASENGQVKIKTEPEELFTNACNSSFIEKETLNSQLGTIRNSDLLIEFAENIEFSDSNELKI